MKSFFDVTCKANNTMEKYNTLRQRWITNPLDWCKDEVSQSEGFLGCGDCSLHGQQHTHSLSDPPRPSHPLHALPCICICNPTWQTPWELENWARGTHKVLWDVRQCCFYVPLQTKKGQPRIWEWSQKGGNKLWCLPQLLSNCIFHILSPDRIPKGFQNGATEIPKAFHGAQDSFASAFCTNRVTPGAHKLGTRSPRGSAIGSRGASNSKHVFLQKNVLSKGRRAVVKSDLFVTNKRFPWLYK